MAWKLAGGSVAGRDHRKGVPRNRQDDFGWKQSAHLTTAVVCDGCGSGSRSEVGASMAVRLLNASLHRHLPEWQKCDAGVLSKIRMDLLAHINVLTQNMGGSFSEVIREYFLFTVLGIVITPAKTVVFGLGDGVYAVNGQVEVLEPEEGNQPIYPAYALTGSELTDHDPSLLDFRVHHVLPTRELEHFLIGTDGATDILARAHMTVPGSDELIGPLEQFWQHDKYFTNKAAIERRLNLIARDWQHQLPDGRHETEGGKLPDDTTIVIGCDVPDDEGY